MAAPPFQLGVVPGGQHDDLHRRVIKATADLDTVELGHHHVENDDRGGTLRGDVEGLVPAGRLHDIEVVGLEHRADETADHRLVIDHQGGPP